MKAGLAAISTFAFAVLMGYCWRFNDERATFDGSEFERGMKFSSEYYKLNREFPSPDLSKMVFLNDTLDASFFDLSQEQGVLNAAMAK